MVNKKGKLNMAFKDCTDDEIRSTYEQVAASNRHLKSVNLLVRATAEKLGARPSDVRAVIQGEDD